MESYFYFGHAVDICTPTETGYKLVIKRVPENCIYITLAECGSATTIDLRRTKEIVDALAAVDYNELLRSRDTSVLLGSRFERNEDVLFQGVGLRRVLTNLHVHFPGDSYVDSYYAPYLANTGFEAPTRLCPSGIFQLRRAKSLLGSFSCLELDDVDSAESVVHALYSYPGLKYPKQPAIEDLYEDLWRRFNVGPLTQVLTEVRIPQETVSNLMIQLPGVHINTLCRTVSLECEQAAISRRLESPTGFTPRSSRKRTLRSPVVYSKNVASDTSKDFND